jgi:hypothetical protein
MEYHKNNKTLSIAVQAGAMRSKYPQFKTTISATSMKIKGEISPSSRSCTYSFVLKYTLKKTPKIWIVSPELKENRIGEKPPHIYKEGNLCLYQPKYHEFKDSHFLFETIIPWTSLWLYFYETWLITDEWLGGGEHPR